MWQRVCICMLVLERPPFQERMMADDKSTQKKSDIKISDLPDKKTNDSADAKVKGGMMPRGGHITYTGEEIDTQTGA